MCDSNRLPCIHDEASFRNPNIVKAVLDNNGNALYFSRAPIPWPRDAFATDNLNHRTCLYCAISAFTHTRQFLARLWAVSSSTIEHFEALEQLRALYHGYKIGVFIAEQAPPCGVDTEQDLQAVRHIFQLNSNQREQ